VVHKRLNQHSQSLNLAGMEVDSLVLVKILIKDIDKKYIDDHALLKKDIENAIKFKIHDMNITAKGNLIITVDELESEEIFKNDLKN
jgi:hypothetical protein